MTVSLEKTKLMVTGYGIEDNGQVPIAVGESEIECVKQFPYLGSLVTSDGRIDTEVDSRLANASKAFGALRRVVFKDCNLTVTNKRRVYKACVLSILLYGSECWTPLRRHLNRLEAFHYRCIRTVLGITNRQQWEQHISSAMTRDLWGDPETVTTKSPSGGWSGLAMLPACLTIGCQRLLCLAGCPRLAHQEDPARDGRTRSGRT